MPEDSNLWAWSKHGLFMVRSAYGVSLKLLRKTCSMRTIGDCSDKTKVAQVWKVVWKLNYPNKIKHFMWRACREILPTNYCLAVRRVSNNDRCGFCGECESSGHILWDCKVVVEVWREVDLGLPRLNQPPRDFVDAVWVTMERKEDTDCVLFAIMTWHIWNNRNKFKHEGRYKELRRIAREVREFGLEIQGTQQHCPRSIARVNNQWKPPQQGRYKVNVDGAVFASWGWCGVGVVIRNEDGLIIGAMSKKLPIPLRATKVEAKALEEGIQLAWDLGFRDIDLESDALVVVGAVVGYDPGPCLIQKVVEGAKLWLRAFRSWSCAHV